MQAYFTLCLVGNSPAATLMAVTSDQSPYLRQPAWRCIKYGDFCKAAPFWSCVGPAPANINCLDTSVALLGGVHSWGSVVLHHVGVRLGLRRLAAGLLPDQLGRAVPGDQRHDCAERRRVPPLVLVASFHSSSSLELGNALVRAAERTTKELNWEARAMSRPTIFRPTRWRPVLVNAHNN
jgi:hypothetical protein